MTAGNWTRGSFWKASTIARLPEQQHAGARQESVVRDKLAPGSGSRLASPSSQSSIGAPPLRVAADLLRQTALQLHTAEQLRLERKLDEALRVCEALVERHPDYAGALHTLGLIFADKGEYLSSLGCLVRAAMHDPQNASTLAVLGEVYMQLGVDEMATQTLEGARRIRPNDPDVLVMLGEIYQREREFELARDCFASALELDQDMYLAAIGLGMAYSSLGQYAEAAALLESLVNRGVRHLEVLTGLNRLPSSLVKIEVVAELEKLLKSEAAAGAEIEESAGFIRAQAFDRSKRYSEAWGQLGPANRQIFRRMRDDWNRFAEAQRAALAKLRQERIAISRSDNRIISLFILGASRSGKTTLEKLVVTLDGVKRGCESPIVRNAVRRTFQRAGLLTGDTLDLLPRAFDDSFRENYLRDLASRAGTAGVFSNTVPGGIADVSRIASVLPNTRFVFVKRNLEDTILRIYMRKYPPGNVYAYDLNSIRKHVIWYHAMIDLLVEKLPDITRVIHYEDMIADPAATLRSVAELCDLPMGLKPLPDIGDDRGCAEPYRQLIMDGFDL